jgi:hypothetical protein
VLNVLVVLKVAALAVLIGAGVRTGIRRMVSCAALAGGTRRRPAAFGAALRTDSVA